MLESLWCEKKPYAMLNVEHVDKLMLDEKSYRIMRWISLPCYADVLEMRQIDEKALMKMHKRCRTNGL
jgi:hypothetical protein